MLEIKYFILTFQEGNVIFLGKFYICNLYVCTWHIITWPRFSGSFNIATSVPLYCNVGRKRSGSNDDLNHYDTKDWMLDDWVRPYIVNTGLHSISRLGNMKIDHALVSVRM